MTKKFCSWIVLLVLLGGAMVSTATVVESEQCPVEVEAAEAAKKASAAASKALFKYRLVKPGTFKTEVGLDWFIAPI
jgi:hypothetical protein